MKRKMGRPPYPDRAYAARCVAYNRARSQARYRNEEWSLTRQDFEELWTPYWENRGRCKGQYSMRQIDRYLGWHLWNVEIKTKEETVKLQKEIDFENIK